MRNFFLKLRIKIKNGNVTLPAASKVSSIVYSVVVVVALVSLTGTFYTIWKIKTVPSLSAISNKNNKAKSSAKLDYDAVLKRNIFNIEGTLPDANSDDSYCPKEPKKSTLAYKVTGIIYGGSAESSIVLLDSSEKDKNLVLKLGDKLPQGLKVTDISADRVYLTARTCPEYLEIIYPTIALGRGRVQKDKGGGDGLSYSESGFERKGNDTTVTKQWVNDVLQNKLSSTLEEARAVPYVVGGQIKGFSITQIVSNSVYEKLGLRNGDIVSSINGIELNDAAKAIQTLNSLRNENRIQLGVIRDGQAVNFKVNVQ